jgi:hypothetical protein
LINLTRAGQDAAESLVGLTELSDVQGTDSSSLTEAQCEAVEQRADPTVPSGARVPVLNRVA